MIILAVIGAIGVVAAIWEELGPRIRRDKTEELDFDDDFEANDVRSAAAQLELEHTWWEMSLEALEAEPAFQLAVSALADADTDVAEVVTLSRDADGWVASMALAALAQREDVPDDWLTWAARNPVRPSVCEDRLLLRALAVHSGQPVIGAGLQALESLRDEVVAEFVRERISRGEQVAVDTFDKVSLETADNLEAFIDRFEGDLGPDFRRSFETWRALANLRNIGRIWERPFDDPPTLLAGRRRELVEIVVAALEQSPPRSVLLVGEHGVGKTALTRAALDRIDEDAIVFETTAAQINAGAIYIGELEGRVKTLVDAVAGQRVIWILPELQETLFAGQHSRSPQGLLDALLPHIESGAIAHRRGGDPCRGRGARRGTRRGSRARSSSYVSDRSTIPTPLRSPGMRSSTMHLASMPTTRRSPRHSSSHSSFSPASRSPEISCGLPMQPPQRPRSRAPRRSAGGTC